MELNNKESLISGLYARVSTGRQEQEATIESQLDEVKARIRGDGNILPDENIFIDDGWTGEMLQRPALDTMRDAALAGKFQALYVYDRGRLARKFAYQEIVIEELTDKGIQFVTLHDVNAVTPEEHVLQAMQGVFHEYERIKIAERMRRGKLFKARNGIVINGQAPYGYRYVKKTDATPTHFEVNDEEAEVVRKVFYWVGVDRISLNEVIKRLYDLGVKPRKEKSDFWTKGPILRMLRNEGYVKGRIYYNKSEACVARKPLKHDKYKKVKRSSRKVRPVEDWIPFKVTPLLPDDSLYKKAKQVLDFNQRFAHVQKQRKYNYLLTSKVFCGCGARRAGDGCSRNGHFYYRCTTRIHKPTAVEISCKAQAVNAVILDGLVWLNLRNCLSDPGYLRQQAEKWLIAEMQRGQASDEERSKLKSLISKVGEEANRYARAYGAGSLDFEQFKILAREVKKKKARYESQLTNAEALADIRNVDSSELDDLCKEVTRVLRSMNFVDKKQVIQDIIDKVIVNTGGEVEVRGHLPLFNQELGQYAASRDCWIAECREEHTV